MVTEYTNVPPKKRGLRLPFGGQDAAKRIAARRREDAKKRAETRNVDSITAAVNAASKAWDAARILERAGLESEARELRDIALRLDRYANN